MNLLSRRGVHHTGTASSSHHSTHARSIRCRVHAPTSFHASQCPYAADLPYGLIHEARLISRIESYSASRTAPPHRSTQHRSASNQPRHVFSAQSASSLSHSASWHDAETDVLALVSDRELDACAGSAPPCVIDACAHGALRCRLRRAMSTEAFAPMRTYALVSMQEALRAGRSACLKVA